jgi:ATP-dependent RNA helicase RhlE
MSFKSLGLCDGLVQGILATGYTAPTEIQSQAIPAAIEGRDVIGCAQTGTGKTAAFVLPILHRLSNTPMHHKKVIRSLILTPTRELAVQIEQAMRGYGRFLPLQTLSIYGGVNIEGQLRVLRKGVDIVVATPGRLKDHMQRRSIDLKFVEVLVLDEADRMFDMGFINDVRKIIAAVPAHRQTLLFSATMSPEVRALTAGIQQSPKLIQVGQQRNPIETITQHIYPVRKDQKMDLLQHMLTQGQMDCVLVFSRTKHGADKISHRLERAGIRSVAIHSNRSQAQRQRALDGFKAGKYQVMVATDIAARGIDVEGISHVINFDVPSFAEDYLHRIGRTGRATAKGDAITFVSHEEEKHFRQIERFIGRKLPLEKCPAFVGAKPELPRPKSVDATHRPASQGGGRPAPGKKSGGFQKWRRKGPGKGPGNRRPRHVHE